MKPVTIDIAILYVGSFVVTYLLTWICIKCFGKSENMEGQMLTKEEMHKRAYELLECIYLDGMNVKPEVEIEIKKLFYMTPKDDNITYTMKRATK
jgi:hypothetical protein